jgi:hypothetical protein
MRRWLIPMNTVGSTCIWQDFQALAQMYCDENDASRKAGHWWSKTAVKYIFVFLTRNSMFADIRQFVALSFENSSFCFSDGTTCFDGAKGFGTTYSIPCVQHPLTVWFNCRLNYQRKGYVLCLPDHWHRHHNFDRDTVYRWICTAHCSAVCLS